MSWKYWKAGNAFKTPTQPANHHRLPFSNLRVQWLHLRMDGELLPSSREDHTHSTYDYSRTMPTLKTSMALISCTSLAHSHKVEKFQYEVHQYLWKGSAYWAVTSPCKPQQKYSRKTASLSTYLGLFHWLIVMLLQIRANCKGFGVIYSTYVPEVDMPSLSCTSSWPDVKNKDVIFWDIEEQDNFLWHLGALHNVMYPR